MHYFEADTAPVLKGAWIASIAMLEFKTTDMETKIKEDGLVK